jgi:hypothetical protein
MCLDVTRNLLNLLMRGLLNVGLLNHILQCLVHLKPFTSADFATKLQILVELDEWKATEFCMFLLYTEPVVLV